MKGKIEVIEGDITKVKAEAIVNAANQKLLGGGGVDGAIHRAAGPELLAYCRGLGGCPTGEAKITPGFQLETPWVIHTVGPVWGGGKRNEDQLLANCYQNCFTLLRENKIRSIAFPSISTGVYRFPVERASQIALNQTKEFLNKFSNDVDKIIFVCFGSDVFEVYQKGVQSLWVS